jgi:hypothetical protein
VERLRVRASEEFPNPNYRIQVNRSIRDQSGINRRPDVAVIETLPGGGRRVVKVYEAVRTNKDGTPVAREQRKVQEYKAAGIPVHQEPVK